MSNIETLTRHSLAAARSLPGILVIDFWAPWCGPCRSIAPKFERAAESRPQYHFAKVNVDEQPTVASAFGGPLDPDARRHRRRRGDRRESGRDRR